LSSGKCRRDEGRWRGESLLSQERHRASLVGAEVMFKNYRTQRNMRCRHSLVAAVFLAATSSPVVAQHSGADWYPSKYGPKDEIGAANLITPEVTLEAVKLVTTGKSYPLAVVMDKHMPVFRHRSFNLYTVQAGPLGPNKLTFIDELVNAWTGVGTQMNGPGHVGIGGVYYNGHDASNILTMEGVTKLGLEKVPPIVTRGVVLDMTEHFGQRTIAAGTEFTVADIKAVLAKEGITLRKGDVVLFNTGWLELIGKDDEKFLSAAPGIGVAAAEWLAAQGIVAFGGDTWCSELYPAKDGKVFPVNQLLLAKHGIYNLELTDTRMLIRDRVYEFLFVLGQPLYKGTTQVNVNPVAIR
jgi:kynurenine formamidase